MSDPHEERPILVTGPMCSGARWMQRFLSQHPRIHVHGQPPEIAWETLWGWHETLQGHGTWAEKINRNTPSAAPYSAGSGPRRTAEVFRRMLRDWLTGFGPPKPRWGLVWPGLCADSSAAEQWEKLWPQTCWIVCLCHPLRTIELAKSTLWPDLDPRALARQWVASCQFLERHGAKRAAVFQADRLAGYAQRRAAIDRVLARIEEKPAGQAEAFLRRWPVTPGTPGERKFLLSDEAKESLAEEVPELEHFMRRLGYPVRPRVAQAV